MSASGVQLYLRLRSRTDGAWIAPSALKERLVADAAEQGSSMNDVAVGILCAWASVAFEPSGRTTNAAPDKLEICLTIPDALDVKLRRAGAAERPSQSAQKIALRVLAGHYGLALPAPPVRRRTRRRATARPTAA